MVVMGSLDFFLVLHIMHDITLFFIRSHKRCVMKLVEKSLEDQIDILVEGVRILRSALLHVDRVVDFSVPDHGIAEVNAAWQEASQALNFISSAEFRAALRKPAKKANKTAA
jgi:hypothetical protein